MDADRYAALYAEVKGKIRWALQTGLPMSISYSDAMDWASTYASDALEQWKLMDEKPNYRPYSRTGSRLVREMNEALDKNL